MDTPSPSFDRAGFERSQFTVRRQYRPENGSYFMAGTEILLDPVECSLAFGGGRPDEIPQVYYPEKAVLAFYLNLGKDQDKLDVAESYLSPDERKRSDIRTSPVSALQRASRAKLARVLVWEIRYEPDDSGRAAARGSRGHRHRRRCGRQEATSTMRIPAR